MKIDWVEVAIFAIASFVVMAILVSFLISPS
jgi:hypothetical protein